MRQCADCELEAGDADRRYCPGPAIQVGWAAGGRATSVFWAGERYTTTPAKTATSAVVSKIALLPQY